MKKLLSTLLLGLSSVATINSVNAQTLFNSDAPVYQYQAKVGEYVCAYDQHNHVIGIDLDNVNGGYIPLKSYPNVANCTDSAFTRFKEFVKGGKGGLIYTEMFKVPFVMQAYKGVQVEYLVSPGFAMQNALNYVKHGEPLDYDFKTQADIQFQSFINKADIQLHVSTRPHSINTGGQIYKDSVIDVTFTHKHPSRIAEHAFLMVTNTRTGDDMIVPLTMNKSKSFRINTKEIQSYGDIEFKAVAKLYHNNALITLNETEKYTYTPINKYAQDDESITLAGPNNPQFYSGMAVSAVYILLENLVEDPATCMGFEMDLLGGGNTADNNQLKGCVSTVFTFVGGAAGLKVKNSEGVEHVFKVIDGYIEKTDNVLLVTEIISGEGNMENAGGTYKIIVGKDGTEIQKSHESSGGSY